MLKFFREKAHIVGWGIVIFFAGTMFSGAVFMGLGGSGASPKPADNNAVSQFASFGQHPIDIVLFNQRVQAYLAQVSQQVTRISPIQVEEVVFKSFQDVVQQQAFLVAAEQANTTLSKVERKTFELEMLLENNLKSMSELKKRLKERDIPYKTFRANMEKDWLVKKFRLDLLSDIQVTDTLITQSFTAIKYDTLILTSEQGPTVNIKQLSETITKELKTDSLATVKKRYEGVVSLTLIPQGEFQSFNRVDPLIRSALYETPKGVYITPVCKNVVCISAKLNAVKTEPKPKDYDAKAYSGQLLSFLQNETLQTHMTDIFTENEINIFIPDVNAVYLKYTGKLDEALGQYQQVSSQYPSSPIPHFFRAELYEQMGKRKLALEELEKGELKTQLSAQNDFPEIHVFYGDLLIEEKKRKSGFEQYQKAFNLVQKDLTFLDILKERYEKHKDVSGLKQVDTRISALKLEIEEEKKKQAALQEGIEETKGE